MSIFITSTVSNQEKPSKTARHTRHTFRTRLSEAGVSDDLAKRLGGWTENATAARYDHAERVEELRAAVEKANNPGKDTQA